MKKNIGQLDRIVRVAVGLVILIVGLVAQSWWGLLGLVLIATGAIGYCGLYQVLGFSTCKLELPAATTPATPATPAAPEVPATPEAEPTTDQNQQPPVAPQQ